jgi:Tfp pilus assembly protein PilN
MTTLTPTRLAQMPRVNLLPPEIAAAARLKRLKTILGLTVLAVMALLILVFLWVSGQVGGAEEELAAAQTEGSALEAEAATYAEVPQVLASVNTAQENLATAMAPEIRWSFYLNDMSLTIPRTTRLVTMTAVNDGAAAQLSGGVAAVEGGGVTTLGQPVIGTMTFSGRSTDFDAVAAWLQSLARQPGYLEPYVQNVTRAEETATKGTYFNVESNTRLSTEALSERYLLIGSGE